MKEIDFGSAILQFRSMLQFNGSITDHQVVSLALAKAVSTMSEAEEAHECFRACGFDGDAYVVTAAIGMYGRCGNVLEARNCFDRIRDCAGVVSWNSMISVLSKCGCEEDAALLFRTMMLQGIRPNSFTFISMARGAANLEDVLQVKLLHSWAIESGAIATSISVPNAILFAYDKCKCIEEARRVFDAMPVRDVASWNTIIAALAHNGHPREAIAHFDLLQADPKLHPDAISYVNALEACETPSQLEDGKRIHHKATNSGHDLNQVVATAIVSMYRRCGDVTSAQLAFGRIKNPGVIAWNAMIAAFAECRDFGAALTTFRRMLLQGLMPSAFTFVTILGICANETWAEIGETTHNLIQEAHPISKNPVVANAIVNMYAKCGRIDEARSVFDRSLLHLVARSTNTWSTMIGAYAHHGRSEDAINLFREMQQQGVRPDGMTYTSVLAASSHGNLVDQGCQIFYGLLYDWRHQECGDKMQGPSTHHHGCIVDLLGRAGLLVEAEAFLLAVASPFVDAATWMSLLSACNVYGDDARGLRAADWVVAMQPRHAGCYAVLANTIQNLSSESAALNG